ncbi:hypothetical protein LAZ67_18002376 [Cordylochernes scorpioides]|uniref:RNA-directed DNA polymerase n=1 Tax=Cordylochernes scorpioides TaxID=51811 RepID=A0ABY6LGQ9_9ARAC|nr:hypothetical protein LAZ67_18002376 [Cordylochernes scorpioides]
MQVKQEAETNKVSIKIPPFWSDKPEIWFYQVEAQFAISGITLESTKFNYLVSQLEPQIVENLWDIIQDSQNNNKYTTAKNRLVSIFKESEEKILRKLLTGLELGDLKPSQLLRKMRTLKTDKDISEKVLQTLWMDKLPEIIKNILVVSEEGLDKLAEMADKIQEMNPRLQVYESKNKDPTFEEMTATIASLKEEIATLKLENRTRQNWRSNSPRPRQRSRSRSRKYNPSGKYCYFHYRFGNLCRPDKCTSPCQWKKPSGNSSGLFVTDAKTGMRFLIDSGADFSLIPFQGNGTPTEDIQLYAANGSLIPTYGFQILDVDLGLRRNFKWRFITARVSKVTSMSCGISTLDKNSKFYNILSSFPNITIPNLLRPKVQHNVRHFIATKGPPVFARARPLNSMLLKIAKKEFQYMLDNHIIRPSRSPWASPLHMVRKKEGSWRPCGDYRKLNSVTIPDRYPIPKLEDFNHILRKTRYYSKIDLFKAYYQIPINEEDREKTAVITPFGLFEFEVMSFGLCGAPATFQRFINQVLWGLDFVFPYLDDILVASKSEEEHESHLRAVFSRLDQYGLRINQAKTVLNVNNVEFLGYWITPEGIRPTESKVQAIVDYKKPETVQDLRRFLGMLNFYRRFLKNAAEDQAILNDFLKGSKKNDKRSIPWTEEAEQKFIKCKTELSKAALLTFPDPECPLALFTDASDRAMGAVLQHFIDGAWKPIAFFSKKLSESQTKYSTYDRELLAIFSAIKHFKFFLEGRDFTIFTDQKPLIYAFQQNLEKASPRQVRQLQYISQFTTSIRHVSGKDNMVADTLSRISEIISVDYDIIAEKQKDDTELSNLRSQNKSLIFKEHRLPSGKTLWCDISTNRIRPYIPEECRLNIFTSIHGLSHPGIKTTVREVTSRYIWLNINKDIRNWTKGCINCQKSKITRHTKTEYGEFGKPDERFGTVHIDLIGPLPPSEGKTYCLTLIDRFTNWVEVLPLEDIKADTIIKSFYKEWISRYGTPCHLITDRGMQFMSQKLKEFAKMCGIQLKHTTSYHPQSNGKIERFHRTLKTAISSHNYIRWTERLPSVLLGLRSAIYGSSDFSLAQMVFGKTIRLPGEFFQDSQQSIDRDDLIKTLQKDMSSLQPMKSRINRNPNVFIHKDLQSCSHVFIRKDRVKKPLEPAYEGPFKVLKRTVKYFTVMVKGKEDNVSLDRLKPAYLLKESYPEDDDRRQQPGIQQDLQPSKARTQKVHFEEPQKTRSEEHSIDVKGEQTHLLCPLHRGKAQSSKYLRKGYNMDYRLELQENGASFSAEPFSHFVFPNFINNHRDFLDRLRNELTDLNFYEKESDLYKFSQAVKQDGGMARKDFIKQLALQLMRDASNMRNQAKILSRDLQVLIQKHAGTSSLESDDLKTINTPYIRAMKKLLYETFLGWLQQVTGIPLNSTVDMTAARYEYTDTLLCHDDELEGRRIAYIYYMVTPWKENDGGTLDLFNTDAESHPHQVVKSLVPEHNKLIFFEVSPVSFHQVREVINEDKVRLSVSGWFHGPHLPPPTIGLETPTLFHGPCHVEHEVVEAWINPLYLTAETQVQVQMEFLNSCQVELLDFLKVTILYTISGDDNSQQFTCEMSTRFGPSKDTINQTLHKLYFISKCPRQDRYDLTIAQSQRRVGICKRLLKIRKILGFKDKFQALVEELATMESWKLVGPPNRRAESLPPLAGQLNQLFTSEAMFVVLSNLTAMALHRTVSDDSSDGECAAQLCRWGQGDYTLLWDQDPDTAMAALDATLFLDYDYWCEEHGGIVVFNAPEMDDQQGYLSVHPHSNSLALVFRSPGTGRFTKHFNHRTGNRIFHTFQALYRQNLEESEE